MCVYSRSISTIENQGDELSRIEAWEGCEDNPGSYCASDEYLSPSMPISIICADSQYGVRFQKEVAQPISLADLKLPRSSFALAASIW
jgi:hypothetical protein